MRAVGSLTLWLLMAGVSTAGHPGFAAVTRISYEAGSGGRSMGTGTVFCHQRDALLILTNAHVVGTQTQVAVEFFRDGHVSQAVAGEVVWRSYEERAHRDMAVVSVPLATFANGIMPGMVPLAPRGSDLLAGDTMTTVGCSGGAWASAVQGHIDSIEGPIYVFTPPPADGRSGSAIYDAEGTAIVGLLAWRDAEGYGRAMTLEEIYRAFEGQGPQQTNLRGRAQQVPIVTGWREVLRTTQHEPLFDAGVLGGGGFG